MTPEPDPTSQQSRLGLISTDWTNVHDPQHFLRTYGQALRKYLQALLHHDGDAEDVLQNLLLQAASNGFAGATAARGRFRDYLKVSARNAAWALRRRRLPASVDGKDLEHLPAGDTAAPDEVWLNEWRQCILANAWQSLERHQHAARGNNLAYLVLRLSVDHADEDSRQLAARAAAQLRQPLSATAFRKQLSRARRLFAELIVAEIQQTLQHPTRAEIQDELAELKLLGYLGDYLPPD